MSQIGEPMVDGVGVFKVSKRGLEVKVSGALDTGVKFDDNKPGDTIEDNDPIGDSVKLSSMPGSRVLRRVRSFKSEKFKLRAGIRGGNCWIFSVEGVERPTFLFFIPVEC